MIGLTHPVAFSSESNQYGVAGRAAKHKVVGLCLSNLNNYDIGLMPKRCAAAQNSKAKDTRAKGHTATTNLRTTATTTATAE